MVLLVHTYPAGSAALERHIDFFNHSGADNIVAVVTEDGDCLVPDGWWKVAIGTDRYMNGPNLPKRLLDTIVYGIGLGDDVFCIAEYDTLFLSPVLSRGYASSPSSVWCHKTGGPTWNSMAPWYSHNPWLLNRSAGIDLVPKMREIISSGHCAYGTAESSPDVFWGLACHKSGVIVHHDPWRQFTRNKFDIPGSLDEAKSALEQGIDVLHGIKTAAELEYLGI